MTPNELEAYSGTSADLVRVQVAMSALMNLVMLYDKALETVAPPTHWAYLPEPPDEAMILPGDDAARFAALYAALAGEQPTEGGAHGQAR